MKTVCGVLIVCVIMFLQTGCGVPEFEPSLPTPPPPLFGEQVSGQGTWYGSLFHGRRTDSGDQFDMEKLTASHESFPLGSVIEVTNPENGKKVNVVINDRHNLDGGYELCLSKRAAELLEVYPKSSFTINFMMIE